MDDDPFSRDGQKVLIIFFKMFYISQGFALFLYVLFQPQVQRAIVRIAERTQTRWRSKILPVEHFIQRENQVLWLQMILSPSVRFISQSLNNYIACSLSMCLIESMKTDIQEGTQMPENLTTQVRDKPILNRFEYLEKGVFEQISFSSVLSYNSLMNFEKRISAAKRGVIRSMLMKQKEDLLKTGIKSLKKNEIFTSSFLRKLNKPKNMVLQQGPKTSRLLAYAPFLFKSLREVDRVDEKQIIDSFMTSTAYQRMFHCPQMINGINRLESFEAILANSNQ
jgi:hypothetical protein